MSRADEESIVQYFTDMAGIERLAAALFAEQRDIVQDPELRRIFESFVTDEQRHAEVAERLADYYDVHHYRTYEMNPNLVRFSPHFVNAVRHVSAEIANAYITAGEMILDIALLRSINDFVDDAMSQDAMRLINRDESRHIAVDFHMVDLYASEAWEAECASAPEPSLAHRMRAYWAVGNMLFHAGPFFRSVFFEPMDLTDPTGRRLKEAFKRIQLLTERPRVARRPFVRFVNSLREAYERPMIRNLAGPVIERVTGVDPGVLQVLYAEAGVERGRRDDAPEDAPAMAQVA